MKEDYYYESFYLPRDIYHGPGSLEELKNLKGKKPYSSWAGGFHETSGLPG